MNDVIETLSDMPLKTVTPVPVDWLKLDHENPRLVNVDEMASDAKIIAQLYRGEDLGELLQSIAASGYIDIEPLIVMAQASLASRTSVSDLNKRPYSKR